MLYQIHLRPSSDFCVSVSSNVRACVCVCVFAYRCAISDIINFGRDIFVQLGLRSIEGRSSSGWVRSAYEMPV